MHLAKPRGLISHGFDLLDESGAVVASLDGSIWSEGGEVRVGPDTWRYRRHGFSGFDLEHDGVVEGQARKRGIFSSALDVSAAGHDYALTRESVWTRPYAVAEGPVALGRIAPTHAFTNAAEVDLPDSVPLHVQVFLAAVVVTQWRRQQSSSAAAST